MTAACLVIRRAVFAEVEGFDEAHLPVAFNLMMLTSVCGLEKKGTEICGRRMRSSIITSLRIADTRIRLKSKGGLNAKLIICYTDGATAC